MWIFDRLAQAWQDAAVRPGAEMNPDGGPGPYYPDPSGLAGYTGPPTGVGYRVGFDPGSDDGPAVMVAAAIDRNGHVALWPYTGTRDAAAMAERIRAHGVPVTMHTPPDPWPPRPDASPDAVVDRLNGRWPA